MLYMGQEDHYTKTGLYAKRIEVNAGLKMVKISGSIEGNRVSYHRVYLCIELLRKQLQDK
jgi:hypothetical protein